MAGGQRLLADAPEAGRAFAPPDVDWRRADDEALGPRLRRAWRVLAGEATAWHPAGSAEPISSERPLLVVDHAEGSQFDALRSAARAGGGADGAGLPDELATLALAGHGFRGQRDRHWQALRGNLHLCVMTRVDLPVGASQAPLTALPALATARAVEVVSDGRIRLGIKWVNDLLLERAKVAGVLTATQVQRGRVTHALFGIGLNVAERPTLPADAGAPRSACLADADPALRDALPALVEALLREIDAGMAALRAGAGADVVDAYRARAAFIGRRVSIRGVDDDDTRAERAPIATGRVAALLDDLALRLEGRAEPVRAGRMTIEDDGVLS